MFEALWRAIKGWFKPRSRPTPQPMPAPMNPKLIKVTSESDGVFVNRMYSYWSSACVLDGSIVVFAGRRDGPPLFFRVGFDGSVSNLGSLVPYAGEAEGWYWNARGELYIPDGPRLRRVNPFTGQDHVVFDVLATHPDCRIWQAHSSDDGRVHCATVQRIVNDGPYPNVATVLATVDHQAFYFPGSRKLDESQVTSDGAYLVIKEDDDNRIVTVATEVERAIADADGAVGHSDCGASCVIGEDNQSGTCVRWDLDRDPMTSISLFSTWNLGHLSIKGGRMLRSDATNLSLVDMSVGTETPLIAHGMIGEGYDYQCHANLSPDGRVAAFVSNMGSHRFDVYLLIL